MEARKIVEVFIESSSEESYSSSEEEEGSQRAPARIQEDPLSPATPHSPVSVDEGGGGGSGLLEFDKSRNSVEPCDQEDISLDSRSPDRQQGTGGSDVYKVHDYSRERDRASESPFPEEPGEKGGKDEDGLWCGGAVHRELTSSESGSDSDSDKDPPVNSPEKKVSFQVEPLVRDEATELERDPSKLYCICGQLAGSYFSIQCHKCRDWFHGSCVGISRQNATKIKEFYCPICIDRDPNLVTVFRSREEEEASSKERQQRLQYSPHVARSSKKQAKKHSRRCGECEACLTEVDCRKCRFCRDMPKYGGPGRMRQKCIKRQCLRLSKILYVADPLHDKKMVLQHDIAAELEAVGGSTVLSAPRGEATSLPVEELSDLDSEEDRRPNVDKDFVLPTFSKPRPSGHPQKKSAKRLKGRPPVGRKGGRGGGGGRGRRKGDRTRLSASDLEIISKGRLLSGRRSRRPFGNVMGLSYLREEAHTPQQCLGPGCVLAARPHSKYCSEECGVQLAVRRIRAVLPLQRKRWGLSGGGGEGEGGGEEGGEGEGGEGEGGGEEQTKPDSMATRMNKEKLEELEGEQMLIKFRLDELDKQTEAITEHVNKLSSILPTKEDESSELESDDLTIYCATCSQPVTLRKAMVHMEKCFSKMEGMVSFGSVVKNEGTGIFCDKYDPSQKTYCKRLRVLCPEHTKEPKIGPNEVCGCPLDPDFPSEMLKCVQFCRHRKRSCVKHYCWEKLRRAEIDQEKLNLYLKLEEVNEQCRLYQWQIDYRGSLLAVMLHHTVDHETEEDTNREKQTTDCMDIGGVEN